MNQQAVRESGVKAAAFISGAALIVLNVMPLLLQALAERYALTATQSGTVASGYNAGTLAATLLAPLWIRRFDWGLLTFVSSLAAISSLGVIAFGHETSSLRAGFVALGLSLGVLGLPALACLGDSSRPARAYSISMFWQMLLAAVFAAALPALVRPRFGYLGEMLALAAVFLPCLLLAPLLRGAHDTTGSPTAQPVASAPPGLFSAEARLAWMVLGAFLLYIAGVVMFWYFVGQLGRHLGVGENAIGGAVAVASVTAVGGALFSTWLSTRISLLAIMMIGVALMISCTIAVFKGSSTVYLVAVSLWNAAWAMSHPMFLALARQVDPTHRLFAASPAVVALGGAIGAATGGYIVDQGGFAAAMSVSALLSVVSCLLAAVCWRRRADAPDHPGTTVLQGVH